MVASHSDLKGMMALAIRFTPIQIDIYSELIESRSGAFDSQPREARKMF